MADEWYYLVGQRQVGPVSREEVRSAVQRGEISPASYVWSEGMEQWAPAASVPGLLEMAAGMVPPAIPTQKENAPGAIGSLVCGIIGLFCCAFVFGIIAIVWGLSARRKIEDNPQRYTGDHYALAAIILGIVGLLIHFAWGGFLLTHHRHFGF